MLGVCELLTLCPVLQFIYLLFLHHYLLQLLKALKFHAVILLKHPDDAAQVVEMVLLAEEGTTHRASEHLFLLVNVLMAFEVVVCGEGAITAVALERPLTRVNTLVLVAVAAAQEALAADVAREWPVTVMELHVPGQVCQRQKRFVTHFAFILTLAIQKLEGQLMGFQDGHHGLYGLAVILGISGKFQLILYLTGNQHCFGHLYCLRSQRLDKQKIKLKLFITRHITTIGNVTGIKPLNALLKPVCTA